MRKQIILLCISLVINNLCIGQASRENEELLVKFISIDGNYDYETIYYELNGEIVADTNLSSFDPMSFPNKGDKIRIKKEVRTIHVAGDNSSHEEDVVTHMELVEKGLLTLFLESTPSVEYIMDEMGSIYEELIPKEVNLFLAASGNEEIKKALEQTEQGTIIVKVGFHQLSKGESWEDSPPRIECEIRHKTKDKNEFLLYLGLTPDYSHTQFYYHVQGNDFAPFTFDF